MPEENKIDYTGIQIPNIESIKRTSQQFTDWRRSMGFQTEEEKLKEAQERASVAWAELGNSEDAYDWYNAVQPNPRKQAKFREDGAKTAGWLMTVPMTIASAGTMGWIPALTTTATGIAGGYGGYKAGEYLDNKLDTKWLAPTLGFAGGMFGGGLGYKGLVKAGNVGLLGTSPYTHLLNEKQNLVYGSQFTKDVVDDIAKSTLNKLKLDGPLRHYLTTRMTPNGSNTEFYETHLYDTLTGKDIGQISTSRFKSQPSAVEHIIGTPTVKGKGRDLYSASWLQNPNGVKSGERLVSPHQTIPTWKHFEHDVLGYYGSHGAAETGGKVVRLKYPERLLPEDAPKIIEYQANPTSKGSYALFERPSKLTLAERMGIPKGERNQPVKLGYRTEFPNDQIINAEPLKKEMLDLFNNDVYRSRLIKAGYSDAQIDDFLKNRMQLGAVRKAPIAISSDVELGDGAHWYRNYVKIHPKTKDIDEAIFHELGHGSDFPGLYQDPRQPKITKLAFPGSKYYLDPSEIRTRGLGVLQWMQKYGKTIDDFYKPGNTSLNKRAREFLIYYPEDQGRQYLSSFWKQGGKIENPDH